MGSFRVLESQGVWCRSHCHKRRTLVCFGAAAGDIPPVIVGRTGHRLAVHRVGPVSLARLLADSCMVLWDLLGPRHAPRHERTNIWFQLLELSSSSRLGSYLLAVALKGSGRLDQPEASRTTIYVSQKVAGDSQFPFRRGDRLTVRIDAKNKRLIIEKA